MKVSIVIPVYNKERFVNKSVMSAVKQSYKDVEVIAVDDGSTDSSSEILKSLSDQNANIQVISQKNAGLSAARNAGINASCGDYVMFHDADDELLPSAVNDLIVEAIASGSDVVGGIFNRVVNGVHKPVKAFYRDDTNINFRERVDLATVHATNFSSCNKIFRKKFLVENDLYFTPGLYMQDIEFWLKCIGCMNKFTQKKAVVANYHFHPGSWSQSRTEQRFQSLFDLYKNLTDFYNFKNLDDLSYIKNKAFLQGAAVFFIKWKLEEWFFQNNIKDIDKVKRLLESIPEADIHRFIEQNKMSPAPRLAALVRSGCYKQAFRFMVGQKSILDDIKSDAKGKMTVRSSHELSDYIDRYKYGKSKRIVIFASGDLHNIGGVQRSYVFLTQRLVDLGYDVSLVGWGKGKEGDSLAYPLPTGVNVFLMNNSFNQRGREEKKSFLKNYSPDLVVIVNSTRYSVLLSALCLELDIPYVQSIRGSSEYCLRYLWPDMNFMEAVFDCSVAGHVLMPSYKNIFSKDLNGKVKAIPSPIQKSDRCASTESPGQDGKYVILYSGRISFEKRVDLLIKAFSEVQMNYPDWVLWIWGNGPLLDDMKALVGDLGLRDKVTFGSASNTDEMYEVYPKVNIKVLPSEQEGCPMALREAMMHKVPAIAFQECSGANEIIENNVDGLLVPHAGGRVAALTSALVKLINNSELRASIAFNARLKAEQYSPESINEKWGDLISYGIYIHYENRLKSIGERKKFSTDLIMSAMRREKANEFCYFKINQNLYSLYRDQYLLIYGRTLFDHKYYLEKNIDVKVSGEDPLLHYLVYGWRLGLDPSPLFSNDKYLDMYDVDICPLYHYYRFGRFEGCVPVGRDEEYIAKWPKRVNEEKVLDVSGDAKKERKIVKKIRQDII